MRLVKRRPGGDFSGEAVVYDNKEEAIQDGVPEEEIFTDPKKVEKAGQYFQYPDGQVTVVMRLYRGHTGRTLWTILNAFSERKSKPSSRFTYFPFIPRNEVDYENIDRRKINFVHDWLFKGYGISEAVRRNLLIEYRLATLSRVKQPGRISLLRFGYHFLNHRWFDNLLAESRPIRDRYMTLINSFEKEGLTDEFLARKLKTNIESDDGKVSNAALFKAIDLLEAKRSKQKPVEVPDALTGRATASQITEGEGTPKKLTAGDRDEYLDELDNELVKIQRVEVGQLERVSGYSDVQEGVIKQIIRKDGSNGIPKTLQRSPVGEAESVPSNGNDQGKNR